jgi:thiol:disulfide interchange protein
LPHVDDPPIGEKTMSSKSDLAPTTALALLPLAAFLFGPAFDAVAPESMPSDLLLSVLPTVLPLAALVVVAVVSYRRTGSAARALRITSLAFAVAALGALAYLLHAWSEASGS